MTAPAADTALAPARTKLAAAISALIDPKPKRLDHGKTTWVDPLYMLLRDALTDCQQGGGHHQTATLPFWIAGMDLIHEIDHQTSQWEPDWPLSERDEWPTILRLQLIDQRKWRPQDTENITQIAETIQAWADKIEEYFDPKTRTWTLNAACPECNEKSAYREEGGEMIRKDTLQITFKDGTWQPCRCLNCKTEWAPEVGFRLLARRIGCEPPTGLLG